MARWWQWILKAQDDRDREVKHPGSRGGRYWIDKHGVVRYGEKPDPLGQTSTGRDIHTELHPSFAAFQGEHADWTPAEHREAAEQLGHLEDPHDHHVTLAQAHKHAAKLKQGTSAWGGEKLGQDFRDRWTAAMDHIRHQVMTQPPPAPAPPPATPSAPAAKPPPAGPPPGAQPLRLVLGGKPTAKPEPATPRATPTPPSPPAGTPTPVGDIQQALEAALADIRSGSGIKPEHVEAAKRLRQAARDANYSRLSTIERAVDLVEDAYRRQEDLKRPRSEIEKQLESSEGLGFGTPASEIGGPKRSFAEREQTAIKKQVGAAAEVIKETKRPTAFRKYDDDGASTPKHWEVSEEDYIAESHRRATNRAETNAKVWEREVARLREAAATKKRPPTRRSRFSLSPLEEAEFNAKHWRETAQAMKAAGGPTDKERERLRSDYIDAVKKALSKGEPVPAPVIAQRPEFAKARDARARYEKGHHTSFANESVAVDRSMQAERGYKVKRQDGKPITEAQKAEIAQGIDEMEEVFGPLGDLMRTSDVTIAHTSGKHPFLSTASGMYQLGERTISMGFQSALRQAPVRSLAHELAHWLDHEAGHRYGHKTAVWRAGQRQSHMVAALSEYTKRASLNQREHDHEEAELLRTATYGMNNTLRAKRLLSTKLKDLKTPEQIDEVQVLKVMLGAYWREPREVFARLVEQYVSTVRGGKEGVAAMADYTNSPGWWTEETFRPLMPAIKKAVARRIAALRDLPPRPVHAKDDAE